MNSTQVTLAIVGVLLLFIGPMFLSGRLARLTMFPRSLATLLGTALFPPELLLVIIGW
jgi:hypothetical protein